MGGSSTPAPGTASGSNSGNTTPAHKSSALDGPGGDGGGVSASAVAAAVVVAPTSIHDPNHWSKKEKYDADAYLEGAYKKHLGRHANK